MSKLSCRVLFCTPCFVCHWSTVGIFRPYRTKKYGTLFLCLHANTLHVIGAVRVRGHSTFDTASHIGLIRNSIPYHSYACWYQLVLEKTNKLPALCGSCWVCLIRRFLQGRFFRAILWPLLANDPRNKMAL